MQKTNNLTFAKRAKSMLRVDFKRAFVSPLVYIMLGICFAVPVLILVMTTALPSTSVDPETGEEIIAETFTNVWQIIGTLPQLVKARPNAGAAAGANMQMDVTAMCNINLLYFAVVVFTGIFVADDFRSGYAKNLFAVRAKKSDYVFSKTLTCFAVAALMFVVFFIGAVIGGLIAGLSFDTAGFGVSGLVFAMLAKIAVTLVFVSITLIISVAAKQKLWLSILGACGAGMLLFTMIPMITPLTSTVINVILCVAGGGLFSIGLGAGSCLVLNKTRLV